MLQGAARVADVGSQLAAGDFSLIFENGYSGVNVDRLRQFVTALWAVYFGQEDPGISIDPIAPGLDKHWVRYIGPVLNSDLGGVMRIADYLMKKWAVGTERPDITGFKSVDALSATHGSGQLGASRRFWFVPEDMRFRQVGDALLFEGGRMTLKTEYVLQNPGRRAAETDIAFARFFTDHYQEIADEYPVYQELFEYAKLVSLARYLKDRGVPMFWFLMANKDMIITEDSPETVDAFAKKSDYREGIQIEGGVDLDVRLSTQNYVVDTEGTEAFARALGRSDGSRSSFTALLPDESVTISHETGTLTLTEAQTLTLATGSASGTTYQTDLGLRVNGELGLELVRYFDPAYEGVATFGRGWHLMIPYRIRHYGNTKIPFLNASIPERMVVENLLTGWEEVLTFSEDHYSIAGYVPDRLETSNLVGLFLLSDASFRLADKLGNEFQFDQDGRMTELILPTGQETDPFHVQYTYGMSEATASDFSLTGNLKTWEVTRYPWPPRSHTARSTMSRH